MEQTIEKKAFVCPEVKVSRDDKHLYIEGYGAYFGNIDSYGDIIKAGAFADFLASEDASRVKLCWQHNFDDIIGVITEMHEDERGLAFKAVISNTTLGRDAATLIEDGALNEFSIGYATRKAEYPENEPGVSRILTDLYIYEISLVSRAANPKATLESSERKGDETINQPKTNEMEAKELQEQLDTMKAEMNAIRDEKTALEQQIAEAKADKGAIEEMKQTIANYDESIKNLDESIKAMNEALKATETKKQSTADAICAAIKSDEFKKMVEDIMDGKRVSGKMEVKLDTGSVSGTILRTMGDTEINADAQKKLVFLNSIRRKDVPQDKSKILWLEGSFTDNTDYVGEGSEVGSADGASASEVTRGLAKVGAKLPFTRETATDLSYFLNWAREEAIAAIRNKVDTLILSGDGADTNSTTQKHIYGIIGQGSTAFSASSAGCAAKFPAPGLIELNDAIDAQIDLGTNGAFVADTIYMHPSDFAIYKNQKDANGRLLFEYENGGIYRFLGKRVVTTSKMTAGSLIVADTAVFDLYEKLGFEIEVERIPKTDSYVLYLRWRGQVVVPSNKKKAVIYVASIATALAALTKGSGSGSGAGQ